MTQACRALRDSAASRFHASCRVDHQVSNPRFTDSSRASESRPKGVGRKHIFGSRQPPGSGGDHQIEARCFRLESLKEQCAWLVLDGSAVRGRGNRRSRRMPPISVPGRLPGRLGRRRSPAPARSSALGPGSRGECNPGMTGSPRLPTRAWSRRRLASVNRLLCFCLEMTH